MSEVTSYTRDDSLVVLISGRVDSIASKELEKQLMPLIDANQTDLVVDCSAIPYISSAGLRLFLMMAKKVGAHNGLIHLCGLQDTMRDVFEISGLTKFFEIHLSVEQALAARQGS
jgi:anti-anti-sigma factor